MSHSDQPERSLALSYAPPRAAAALEALFALDATLAHLMRSTREPLVGQMRLTWWHGALTALDTASPPAQPVLQALADTVIGRAVTGAHLAGMVDGWEALLDAAPIDEAAMQCHAIARGGGLFAAAGAALGCDPGDPIAAAGQGWALADLARHVRDADAARRAAALAASQLAIATTARWSRAGRALGALAHIARMDLAVPLDQPIAQGSPRRVARLALHRITGR